MRKFLLATTLALVPGFSFAQTFNVKSYGAAGDCVSDDSKYIAIAEKEAMRAPQGGFPIVYFPAGCYVLGSNATLPMFTRPMGLKGDGQGKSYLFVQNTYVGDVISYSETWGTHNAPNSWSTPAVDFTKGFVMDLSIFSPRDATPPPADQNGIMLYDRNAAFLIQNVEIRYLHGKCLGIGAPKAVPQAWTIESDFVNFRCYTSGPLNGDATVDISSYTSSGSDASNELKFVNLDIFQAPGKGLQIRNPNNFSSTRLIDCVNCRVENSGDDNVTIGSSSDAGRVSNIHFVNLQSITPANGHYAVNLDTAGLPIYDLQIRGAVLGPCLGGTTCYGLNIGNVSSGRIEIGNMAVNGTAVTIQSTMGTSVLLDGNGTERSWTYNFNGQQAKVRTIQGRCGDPTSTTTPC